MGDGQTMFNRLSETAAEYTTYYGQAFWSAWRHITPSQYAGLLIAVLVIGWLLMKNSTR